MSLRHLAAVLLVVAVGGCPKHRPPPPKPAPAAPMSGAAYSHYLRGRVAMYEADYEKAVLHFRAAVGAASHEAPIRVALIDALLRAGENGQAARAARAAQKRFPDHAAVWAISGRVYRGQRHARRAVKAYQRAIHLDPDREASYLGLAGTWVFLRQPRRAEKIYRALLARQPDSLKGHYRLAIRLIARNHHRKARRHLARALEIEPDHIEARIALARTLRKLGKRRASIATLRQAFDRSGGDPDVGEQLFRQLLEVGDRGGAISLLGVIDRDDLAADVRISFGYLYLQVGAPKSAGKLARAIQRRHSSNADAQLLEAHALADQRRPRAAIQILLSVAPTQPAYPECRAFAAELLVRRGNRDRALEILSEPLAKHATNVNLIASHALVYEARGDVDRARAIFRDALAKAPTDADILYSSGSMEDRLGKPERAIEIIGHILDTEPDNATAMNFIGYSLADRNVELPRAEKLLRRAIALSPGNGYVLDSWGWFLFRKRQFAAAERTLWRAARLAPAEPEILWHLGELYLARNQRGKALKLLKKARSLGPEGAVQRRIEARIQALRPRK